MKIEVFNIETGKSAMVSGVDAREYVKSGGWSMSPPEPEIEVNESKDPPEPEIVTASVLANMEPLVPADCEAFVKELTGKDYVKVTQAELQEYCLEKFNVTFEDSAKKTEVVAYIKSRQAE